MNSSSSIFFVSVLSISGVYTPEMLAASRPRNPGSPKQGTGINADLRPFYSARLRGGHSLLSTQLTTMMSDRHERETQPHRPLRDRTSRAIDLMGTLHALANGLGTSPRRSGGAHRSTAIRATSWSCSR
jgi:hypothetical protein